MIAGEESSYTGPVLQMAAEVLPRSRPAAGVEGSHAPPSRPRPGPAAERRGRAGPHRPPRWLRAADACQRSLRHPLPVAFDLAVGVLVTGVLTDSAVATAAAAAGLLVTGLLFGVWRRRSSVQAQGVGWYIRRVLPGTAISAGAVGLCPGVTDQSAVAVAVGISLCLVWTKLILWVGVSTARRRGLGLNRTLVIGPEHRVASVEYRIHLYPEAGLVCAHTTSVADMSATDTDPLAVVERLLTDHSIDHVVCAGADSGRDSFVRDVVRVAASEVDVTIVEQVPLAGSPPTRLGDLAVICLARPSWGTDFSKRVFDVVASALLLVVVSPLLAVTSLAIRLGDPGPAIFRQLRTGRHNQMFTILKFRSMVEDAEHLKMDLLDRNVADGPLFKAENDPRITPVGAVIRRFSVDELPQLVNVLKGDMSLVGPRPLPSVFDESDVFAAVRHRCLPGITGLWQVKGANALSYEDMLDLDCAYVATRSLGSDLRILLQTLPAVLVRRDPY